MRRRVAHVAALAAIVLGLAVGLRCATSLTYWASTAHAPPTSSDVVVLRRAPRAVDRSAQAPFGSGAASIVAGACVAASATTLVRRPFPGFRRVTPLYTLLQVLRL